MGSQLKMKNPFSVVKDFEDAVAEYCGAPYCVAVNSCTNALFLSIRYLNVGGALHSRPNEYIEIPKHTYLSVPMQIKLNGFQVKFRDDDWTGSYKLEPFNIFDSARRFTWDMYRKARVKCKLGSSLPYECISFHWAKILGIQQGGAILHGDPEFDIWARKARFDGRTEGVAPKDDNIDMLGWHCYMSPEIAAEGLVRLHHLPKHNADLPNDDYPDLSKMEIFK